MTTKRTVTSIRLLRAAAASALAASALLVLGSNAEAVPPGNTPGMRPGGHCSTTATWCGALMRCATVEECCTAQHEATCGRICANLSTDFQNCGACGRVCSGVCRGGTCTPSHASSSADTIQDLDLTIAVSPSYAITSATDDDFYTPTGSTTKRRPIYDVFTPQAFFWHGKLNVVNDTPLSGGLPKPGWHGDVPLNGLENVFRSIFFDSNQWQSLWAPVASVPCDVVHFIPGRPTGTMGTTTSCVGDLYDNQIRYDAARGRFWISSGARSPVPAPLQRINLIAVSKTSDPHEGFFTYVSSDHQPEQADDPWFAVHNDLAIAYAISADHPFRIHDANALANGSAAPATPGPVAQLQQVFVNGGAAALQGDPHGTPRVAKHHAPSDMTYVVVGSGSRLSVFGIKSDATATTPARHALVYGPATYDDPTRFVWDGDLGDVIFDGTSLYVFSGQASNVSRRIRTTS